MLNVTGLTKQYQGKDVLRNVSFDLAKGEVVALIGRSGAGKSTLGRCLVGLETADAGQIALDNTPVAVGRGAARQDIQYLWQDPLQSLSPYLTAREAVLETLNGFGVGAAHTRREVAARGLSQLGLSDKMQQRRPHDLSGGQCQRVALARALAACPKLLLLDEPFSALDLSTQLKTIDLLKDLHQATGVAMLIASHDLAPLRHLAQRVLVLDHAEIVEDIPMDRFMTEATHPLAQAYANSLAPKTLNSSAEHRD